MTAAAHVPHREIVARVTALPDVHPHRIDPVLLPMWQVELLATVREAEPYDVLDRHLARALAEAGLRDPDELAAFFGLSTGLVERVLAGLAAIGHLRADGQLTELGRRSAADGRRYRDLPGRRVTVWFDGFRGAPVPRTHGLGSVFLSEPALTLADGTRFEAMPGAAALPESAVDDLLARIDLPDFSGNVLAKAEVSAVWQMWLPAYVVECDDAPLVFVKAVDGPDPYLSGLLRHRTR
ncbi:hypothetical protein GCM10010168_74040 [Actinoplanes ianthinogenes]|uniref:Uncharacterized protein n=1 Tax=Actinoplanes ianthinogenes TaxID=122358 RepID=A0ABM7LMW6_9ACTN|nr:hypothetical protein [Actinoplanes ianthinogenes]BCJ40608.1 hypothetical protein Aiant_12650 [Actinoplanes ianthinogenes]GGR44142.1 hypothetical protein GCM10010168_74040 [Actinoplanes ianthinogenes]